MKRLTYSKTRAGGFIDFVRRRHNLVGLAAIVGTILLWIQVQPFAQAANLTWTASLSTTWDSATANWTGDADTYNDGDDVNFTDPVPSGGAVVIQPAGINPGQVNVSNNFDTYTFSGGPIGGTDALYKTGSGTLVLSSSNSYFGGTTISGGTVAIASDDALGDPSGVVTLDGGELSLQGVALDNSRNIVITANNGVIDTGGIDSSSGGSINGPGTLIKTGGGDFSINGSIGSSQTTGISVLGGSLTFNEAGSQFITTATTPGDFTGDLNIGAGVSLQIAGGSTASPVLINGGGAVNFMGSGASITGTGVVEIDNNIGLNNKQIAGAFSSIFNINLSGQLTVTGVISGTSDVTFNSTGAGSPLFLLDTPAIYDGNTNLDFVFGGVLRIGVDNALSQGTQLAFGGHAGALDLNGFDQTVGALSDQGYDNGITNTGNSTSTFTVEQSIDTTYYSTIGTPTVIGPNLSSGQNLNNINFVKAGTGSLRVSGYLTYTGSTTVSGGTLVVDGGISGSPGSGGIENTAGVTVTAGATLAGTGVIDLLPNGQVDIQNGATIAPGDSSPGTTSTTGILSIADPSGPASFGTVTFNLEGGATLLITLAAFEPGGSQDPGNKAANADSELAVAGNISLTGSLAINLLDGFTANPGDLFFIILNQGSNAIDGYFAGNPSTITATGNSGTVTFDIGYNGDSTANPPSFTGGNDVVLEVATVAIPEPGAAATCLTGLGWLAMGAFGRRRRPGTDTCLAGCLPVGCASLRRRRR